MRNRTPIYVLVGVLLGGVLIAASTNIAAVSSRTPHSWVYLQQHTPLLWMVDGCAFIILMGSWLLGAALAGLQTDTSAQSDENTRHIAVLTETIQDMFQQNREYAERLEALEEAGDAWHEGFEEEARRLTEQAFLALSENIESNATQLEAVNLALRYQRAEMTAFRDAFKTGFLAPNAGSPPSLDPVDRPMKPVLPDWRKPRQEIEAAPVETLIPVEIDVEELDETDVAVDEPDAKGIEAVSEHDIESEVELLEDEAGGLQDSDPELEAEEESDEIETSAIATQRRDEPDIDSMDEVARDEDHPSDASGPELIDEELTVNAGSTVVETLDLDVEGDTAIVSGADRDSKNESRSALAAEEFRRVKREPRSIFRRRER